MYAIGAWVIWVAEWTLSGRPGNERRQAPFGSVIIGQSHRLNFPADKRVVTWLQRAIYQRSMARSRICSEIVILRITLAKIVAVSLRNASWYP